MATEAADVTSVARVKVEAEGADQLKALADSFAALAKAAKSAGEQVKTVSPAGRAAQPSAKPDAAQASRLSEQTVRTINRIFEPIGRTIGTLIRLPFDALKAAIQATGPVLAGITDMFGSLFRSLTQWVASFGPAAPVAIAALAGIGVAATNFVIAAGQVAIGFKLLSSSFDWAKQWMENALKIQTLTRQLRPGAVGPDFEAAKTDISQRMRALGGFMGAEAAQSATKAWEEKIDQLRTGEMSKEDTERFARWGITIENLNRLSREGKPIDLASWLGRFHQARERLEKEMAAAPQGSQLRESLGEQLRQMVRDAKKIVGEEGANLIFGPMLTSVQEMFRRSRQIQTLVPKGADADAEKLKVSLWSLKGIFEAIQTAIGANVAPTISKFLDELYTKMLPVKEGGQGLGQLLIELGSAFANHAWDVLRLLVKEFVPSAETLRTWLSDLKNTNPEETKKKITAVIDSIKEVGDAFVTLGTGLKFVWNVLTYLNPAMEVAWNGMKRFFEYLGTWVDWLLEKVGLKTPSGTPGGGGGAPGGGAPGDYGGGWGGGGTSPPGMGGAVPRTAPAPSGPTFEERWRGEPTAPTGRQGRVAPGYTVPVSTIENYITAEAKARNIDPNVALTVFRREGIGAWQSTARWRGRREPSWGPYQLFTAGGLGNVFQRTTGLDPRDPSTWQENINFALDHASRHGWGSWMGAKAAGIRGFRGIGPRPGERAPIDRPDISSGPASDRGGRAPISQWGDTLTAPTMTPDIMFNPGAMGRKFGEHAAESLKEGLDGVTIPAGVPSNSRGVAPRSAPKETGGDTASEG